MKPLSSFLPSNFPSYSPRDVSLQPVSDIEVMRWETLATKEPETINWISSMKKESVFIDIGANIGPYTLTAYFRGVANIVSFEPFPASFHSLENTLRYNSISTIHLFRMGISDELKLVNLVGQSLDTGAAEFSYTQSYFNSLQTCLLCRFDPFLPLLKQNPIYIKVDVDGSELSVLDGLSCVLELKLPISILVESDVANLQEVTAFMSRKGFVRDEKYDGYLPHSDSRRLSESGNTARNIFFSNQIS